MNTHSVRFSIALGLIVSGYQITAVAANRGPGFSLRNKSGRAINITVENGSDLEKIKTAETIGGAWEALKGAAKKAIVLETNTVLPKGLYEQKIETGEKTKLTFYDNNGNKTYEATFIPGRTIYVNWDPSHKPALYPQRGPLMGITGETDEGYSLKSNVKEGDIKLKKLF